ncbi:LPXTG cell wall anchor domain-containing protein [Agrococcus jejuensis]|uniref:LPXTG-motif cell wall anchor domain-containing protein n=1 Tax=Agrococcus jejuensis TaxID=399736 RepID=A0A1G8BCX0_9MICO|nr:LPXTG cell wall anchor domain-containing protein [Agrococcus jejuensis]SDH30951.1 LPXTG-motif cell wall anchor domain-containing protein [Agrococcus jejuensis]
MLLLTALLSALLVTFSAAPAQAHDARPTPSCTGLNVNAWAYNGNAQNRVVVTIDGEQVASSTFGQSYNRDFSWSTTEDHTYRVQIFQGDGTQFNKSFTGTWTACEEPPATETGVTTEPTFQDVCGPEFDLAVPADTEAYRFTVADSTQGGQGDVVVTATLDDGFVWTGGSTEPRTWTFHATNEPCDVAVDVPAQPTLQDVCGPDYGEPTLPASEAYTWSVDDSALEDGAGTVTITATLDDGFVWTGGGTQPQSWTYDVTNEPCDVPTAVEGTPTVLEQCGPGYEVQLPVVTDADGYAFSVDESGVTAGQGTVVVTATLADGFTWQDGSTEPRTWSFDVTDEPCVTEDIPVPTATEICGPDGDAPYTIPADGEHYRYVVTDPGTYTDGERVVEVVVEFDEGYVAPETDETSWTFTFYDEPCDTPVAGLASADVTVTGATCWAPGTATPGETERASWTVSDVPAAGGTATFVAVAEEGAAFQAGLPGVSDDLTTRTFTLDVPAAGGELCTIAPPPVQPPTEITPPTTPQSAPPTLPRTGFDISSILAMGALLALAGATLVVRRVRSEA